MEANEETVMRVRRSRGWTVAVAGVSLLALTLLACGQRPIGPRILLVTLDTTRADHLSPWGYDRDTSPNLAALARSGVVFRRAYCNMPSTDPSHVTMLTGLYPRSHGITRNGQKVVEGLASLPSMLQQTGCATAAFVSRKHLDPADLGLSGFQITDAPEGRERLAEETASRAIRWLQTERPSSYFLWVHLFDPHSPYEPPPEFADRFGTGPPQSRLGDGSWLPTGVRYAPGETANNARLYDAEISYADAWLGRVVAAAKALPGPAPLIVVAADHGESFDELQETFGYAFSHGEFLYDHQTAVPWVMQWDGRLPAARVTAGLVELADVTPTIVALAGLTPSARFDGTSRASLALGNTEEGAKAVFLQRRSFENPPRPWLAAEEFAIVAGWHKLIVNRERGAELYDLKADPSETVNRASIDAPRAEELRSLLSSWLHQHPSVLSGGEPDAETIENLKSLGYVN